MVPEDESVILSSFYNTMVSLSVKQGQFSFLCDRAFVSLQHCKPLSVINTISPLSTL